MKLEKREFGEAFTLSTGRSFGANNGILGISPDGDISEGYDGGIWPDGECFDNDFTPDERREIADFAIAAWEKYARDGRPPR